MHIRHNSTHVKNYVKSIIILDFTVYRSVQYIKHNHICGSYLTRDLRGAYMLKAFTTPPFQGTWRSLAIFYLAEVEKYVMSHLLLHTCR